MGSGYFREYQLRQMDDGDIAAMAIDCVTPLSRHLKPDSPSVLARLSAWFVGNVIAVVDDDWKFL